MLERNLLEKEVIKNKRGKPTLYRLNSRLFVGLRECRAYLSVEPQRQD
jgi:hypothetical protein